MSLLPENHLLVAMENAQVKIFDAAEKSFQNPVSLKAVGAEESKTWAGFGVSDDKVAGTGSDGVVGVWSLQRIFEESQQVPKLMFLNLFQAQQFLFRDRTYRGVY